MDINSYQLVEPNVALRPFIRRFMVADSDQCLNETVYPKPTGYNYLHWIIRGEWRGIIDDDARNFADKLFITGQIKDADISVTHYGRFQHIVAEFTALGFYQMTGLYADQFINKAVEIHGIDMRLQESLSEVVSVSTQDKISDYIRILEDKIISCDEPLNPVPDYLRKGVELIENKDGLIKIKSVYDQLDISKGHFIRIFKKIIGMTPKYFARVLQMNRVVQAMVEQDNKYFADMAAEYGYYDESHLQRAIQEFFKHSPGRFLDSQQETLFAFLGQSRKI